MEELRKENNRLFGRLLNIYEVSIVSIICHFETINATYLLRNLLELNVIEESA